MKPLTAQNGGAFKKQSSASLPVSDTSTQVASAENMHSWDRGLEPGRQSTPRHLWRTLSKDKLGHMVPGGIPVVYCSGGETKLSLQRAGRKAGYQWASIRALTLSLFLSLKRRTQRERGRV